MSKHKFDTEVQVIKYKVLKAVAEYAWEGTLLENIAEIPKHIMPGKTPTMRCCVYKERAIVNERVKLAVGGNRYDKKVIQVIDIACDDCPAGGYVVTSACRGCLAHRCAEACKVGAITFGKDKKAQIDKSKCVECGMCYKSCQFGAIGNLKRPCEMSCKAGAISMGDGNEAQINYEKCVSCGACVYMCPFGAITDRSYILDVIEFIKNKETAGYKVNALVAPAMATQFGYASLGKAVTAIKELGFDRVYEVALGADMVAESESGELIEKGFLTSSCCPAFVAYIEKNFPKLKDKISHNLSPAGTLAKFLKEKDEKQINIFIGPCTAKKTEFQRKEYAGYIDSVITFEELQALIDSKKIEVSELEESKMDDASYFGRIFARSGGVTDAVRQAIKEKNIDYDFKPIVCSGISECKKALMLADKGLLPNNFIEGMACIGGCVGGAGNLTHDQNAKAVMDNYGNSAEHKEINSAINNAKNSD